MKVENDLNILGCTKERTWIQPSIENLDLLFFTQKIINNTYSVIDEKIEVKEITNQNWFWTDEWQLMEQKVDNYITRGQVEEYKSIDEFITSLKE
jgi:DNA mismatch repair ATPase MutS